MTKIDLILQVGITAESTDFPRLLRRIYEEAIGIIQPLLPEDSHFLPGFDELTINEVIPRLAS